MSIYILVDAQRNVAFNGIRGLRTAEGKIIDHVYDWSDLDNAAIQSVMMDQENAERFQQMLANSGYNTEVVKMSQDSKLSVLWIIPGAMIVGAFVAMVFN
jgi:hypothetical protein